MTPHHPAADRLFGEGCCLCGNSAGSCLDGTITLANKGERYCDDCYFTRGLSKLDAEITRRKSLATPPASASEKWEPKVGEWCRGDHADSGVNYQGQFVCGGWLSADLDIGGGKHVLVTRASLVPLKAASAQRIESEPKAPLCDCCGEESHDRVGWSYPEHWTGEALICRDCFDIDGDHPEFNAAIERVKVRLGPGRQPRQPPAPPAMAKGADPYKVNQTETEDTIRKWTDEANDAERHRSVAIGALSDDPLRKLAAKRARHVSECRASLESDGKARKAAVSTHPKSWPADAGETYELAATEGWSGR